MSVCGRSEVAVSLKFKRDLIKVVKKIPALYDARCPDYKDVRNRPLLWQTVRDLMIAKGYSEVEAARCPIRWKSLRASYAKERIAAMKCATEGNSYKSRWLLYDDMEFFAAHIDDSDNRDLIDYETSDGAEPASVERKSVVVEDALTESDEDSASDVLQRYKVKRRRSVKESRAEEALAHVHATSSAVMSLCKALLREKTSGCGYCGHLTSGDRQFMRTLSGLTSQLDRTQAERFRKYLLQVACADYAKFYAESRTSSNSDSLNDK
ncbi:hypothetical protein Tcan_18281 [Toxocara canis]|uniref:MADF domain-containing protein n=1 Tax=Toxocara canis TaxID=6265 RepID=A0A0B2VEW7_TOXCA|nr:hypothetical protein Tcan_18281 [Toxocara canis]